MVEFLISCMFGPICMCVVAIVVKLNNIIFSKIRDLCELFIYLFLFYLNPY